MLPVAIIPARGKSKRIFRKNVRLFKGQPALCYPIRAALESQLFSRVIVSTEDAEIAEVATTAGAEVFQRPDQLADDITPIGQVCAQVLRELKAESSLSDRFCLLYATGLFVTPADLSAGLQLLDGPLRADRVVSVSEYGVHPYKALSQNSGYLTPLFKDQVRKNTQDYPNVVAHNGVFCWARSAPFLENPIFVGPNAVAYRMPAERSVDIDTPEDWRWAELLADAMERV